MQEQASQRGFKTPAAARYLGVSPSLLRKFRLKGCDDPGQHGPKYVRFESGLILYTRESLDAWLSSATNSDRAQGAV